MREILFRGKRIGSSEWIYGYYVPICFGRFPCKPAIVPESDGTWEPIEVKKETVGQYTGLIDKNGKKIFDGDICKFREWDNGEMCWTGYVNFEHCQFIISGCQLIISGGPNKECLSNFYIVLSRFSSKNIEVIGNIHDTPELLEGKS